MSPLEMIRIYIEYHIALTRKVWESIDTITDEQYLQEDAYSRGSIRNLMVHLTSVDRRWLAGLKDLPDVGQLAAEDYPDKTSGRALFENVARDLAAYVAGVSQAELEQNAAGIPSPRMLVLYQMINHGTDHRATVLQALNELSAPSFGQDFILWLWDRK
jgi:uncharacterized damage-inducible protein DinB